MWRRARELSASAPPPLNSLNLAVHYGLRSIAFPCISTGIYGFDKVEIAARIALSTVKGWLGHIRNRNKLDWVVGALFLEEEEELYTKQWSDFYPDARPGDQPRPVMRATRKCHNYLCGAEFLGNGKTDCPSCGCSRN